MYAAGGFMRRRMMWRHRCRLHPRMDRDESPRHRGIVAVFMSTWSDSLGSSAGLLTELKDSLDATRVGQVVATMSDALAQDRPLLVCGKIEYRIVAISGEQQGWLSGAHRSAVRCARFAGGAGCGAIRSVRRGE
jgi:hypothetical protein